MPDLSWEFSLAWAGAEPAKCRFTHRSVGRAVVSVQWRAQKNMAWDWVERTEITLRKKQHPQDLRPGKSRICIAGGSAGVLQNSGQNSPRGGRNNGARAGHISRFQTADLVPAARFAPGFCILASQPRMKGWRSAESRTGARTPVGLHMTRQARRLARRLASLGDARLSALAPWRFWAAGPRFPSPAFAPDRSQRTPASGSQCPAGGPGPPGQRLRATAAGRHASLRLQDASGRRPSLSKAENGLIPCAIRSQ